MMLGLETILCYFAFSFSNDCLPFYLLVLSLLGLSIRFLNCIAMALLGSMLLFIYIQNTYFSFELRDTIYFTCHRRCVLLYHQSTRHQGSRSR